MTDDYTPSPRELAEGRAWLARQPLAEPRTEIERFLRDALNPQRDQPPIEGGWSADNPPPEIRAARAAAQEGRNEMLDNEGNFTDDEQDTGQDDATENADDGEDFESFTAAEMEVYNQLSAEDQAAIEQLGQDDPERQQALLDELVAIAAGDPEARARAEAGVAEQGPPPGVPEHAFFHGRLSQAGWDQHLADLRARGRNLDGSSSRGPGDWRPGDSDRR